MSKENKTENIYNISKTNQFDNIKPKLSNRKKEVFEKKLIELFEVMCETQIEQDKQKYWRNHVISDSLIKIDRLFNGIYQSTIPGVVSYIYKPCAISNEGKLIEVSKNILDLLKKHKSNFKVNILVITPSEKKLILADYPPVYLDMHKNRKECEEEIKTILDNIEN